MKKINTTPLNKFLAYAGVCSRRNAVDVIKSGDVKVNGKIEKNPAYQLQETDVVLYKGKTVRQEKKIYIILNKPKGVVTTVSDEKGRNTVLDLLGKRVAQRVYPVGRLDVNTTGLLLLTNDGDLADRLAHPRYGVVKEYAVTLSKPFTDKDRRQIMKGVRLRDSGSIVNIDNLSHPFGKEKNKVRIVLHSGKYRVVRRIFESIGFYVNELDRVKFAGISKRGLALGEWRVLTPSEVERLKKIKVEM